MSDFEERYPSTENYWRSVILFGKNVASYKFALAASLLELAQSEASSISYDELAIPFSKHVARHLQLADKQGTSSSSKFLSACRQFNSNQMTQETLVTTTAKLGFVNVIDAFHIVNNKDLPIRFFKERSDKRGIELTDDIYRLAELQQFQNLPFEVESRWRLVETAWELNISRNIIAVEHDDEKRLLFTVDKSLRRVGITSSRSALNGYQKGKCFYCFTDLSLNTDVVYGADVDHFFPHTLRQHGFKWINGIWNLVLSCYDCNRGTGGKFAQVPEMRFLERLHKRNEFLVSSHHPLRETLMTQTGIDDAKRRVFLNEYYDGAVTLLIHKWRPLTEHAPVF